MATFQGFDVTHGLVPIEVTAALPANLTEDDFKIRLNSGGTMELIDSHWVIGDADFTNHSVVFAALDKLSFKGNSGIVTNGNTLVLFVNDIESENAQILSFKDDTLKAPKAADGVNPGDGGGPGRPGIGGGNVSIHVVQTLNGILNFNLLGQDGGDGGQGVSGVQGVQGSPGTPCQAGVCLLGGFIPVPVPCCKHDGGQGGKGGVGSPGGHGGDGGTAGGGGNVFLFNVGTAPLPAASFKFAARAGTPGNGGTGGAGGPGGPGGPGGDANTVCHGGNTGPVGDVGRHGDNGSPGSANASGSIVAQNLDLTTTLAQALGVGHH